MRSFVQSVWLKARVRVLRYLKLPVSFRFRGQKYWLNSDYAAAYHIDNSTGKLAKMVELIPPDAKVVFDVGGNCGIFSAMAAKRCPKAKIYCFEPSSELVPVIQRNCRENVKICQWAVADKDGEIQFYVNEQSQQTNSVMKNSVEVFASTEVREMIVPSRTIDSIAKEFGIDTIDVLKIDIQGAEELAFRGAGRMLQSVSMLFVESSWLDLGSVASIIPFSRKYGFSHIYVINPVQYGADLLLSRGEIRGASKKAANAFSLEKIIGS